MMLIIILIVNRYFVINILIFCKHDFTNKRNALLEFPRIAQYDTPL